MGGPGAGHKSERARRARLANIAKARAARKREPLRWRSGLESRVIEQLVWQWWLTTSGEWLVASGRNDKNSGAPQPLKTGEPLATSGWKKQERSRSEAAFVGTRGVVRRGRRFRAKASPVKAGVSYIGKIYSEADRRATEAKLGAAGRPWAKLRVARLLGVSHTWVNKLAKRFEADPDRMRRRMAGLAPASLEKLERARQETRRQRELGWLRGPIRTRRVKWTHGGKTQRAMMWTHAERRRREGKDDGRSRVRDADVPAWARGT